MTRSRWLLLAGGVLLTVFFYLVLFRPWTLEQGYMVGAPFGRDFVNFWLGGRLALDGNLALLADIPAYQAAVSSVFQHRADDHLVFSYPPHILPFLVPFALMPYGVAVVLWSGLNLAGLWSAARLLGASRRLAALVLLSPASLIMVIYGHFGGLCALCLTFALRRGLEAPILAGAGVALLSIKPQLAVSFGVLLGLVGLWRVVAVAVIASLAAAALSALQFGTGPWIRFATDVLPYHAALLSEFRISNLRTTISAYSGLRMLDVAWPTAMTVQAVVSAVTVVAVPLLVRRGGERLDAVALLLLGGLAILPYANHYDLVVAAAPLTMLLFAHHNPSARLAWPTRAALQALWVAPAVTYVFALGAYPAAQVAFLAGTVGLMAAQRGGARGPMSRSSAEPGTGWGREVAQGRLGAQIGVDGPRLSL